MDRRSRLCDDAFRRGHYREATDLKRRWHGASLAIAASILLVNCACRNSGQSAGTDVPAITRPAAQSAKAHELKVPLSVQLVNLEGRPLERQTLVMMPLSEGYSESVRRGPFWADRDGKVIVDSLAPGRHRFVINQEWPTPTFVEFTVPPDGHWKISARFRWKSAKSGHEERSFGVLRYIARESNNIS